MKVGLDFLAAPRGNLIGLGFPSSLVVAVLQEGESEDWVSVVDLLCAQGDQ